MRKYGPNVWRPLTAIGIVGTGTAGLGQIPNDTFPYHQQTAIYGTPGEIGTVDGGEQGNPDIPYKTTFAINSNESSASSLWAHEETVMKQLAEQDHLPTDNLTGLVEAVDMIDQNLNPDNARWNNLRDGYLIHVLSSQALRILEHAYLTPKGLDLDPDLLEIRDILMIDLDDGVLQSKDPRIEIAVKQVVYLTEKYLKEHPQKEAKQHQSCTVPDILDKRIR